MESFEAVVFQQVVVLEIKFILLNGRFGIFLEGKTIILNSEDVLDQAEVPPGVVDHSVEILLPIK